MTPTTTCACGLEVPDSPDGRRQHQMKQGHRFTPERAAS